MAARLAKGEDAGLQPDQVLNFTLQSLIELNEKVDNSGFAPVNGCEEFFKQRPGRGGPQKRLQIALLESLVPEWIFLGVRFEKKNRKD